MPDETQNTTTQEGAGQNGGASGAAGGTGPASAAGVTPATWEAFLEGQPQEVKTLYEGHVTGLKNTVQATRKERDDLTRELREAAKKLEKGTEAETQLTGLAAKLEDANRRADFFENAVSNECKNPKAAYAIAASGNLFTRSGDPDWKAIRETAPELFGKPQSNAQPGAGSGNSQPGKMSMDEVIRSLAKGQ